MISDESQIVLYDMYGQAVAQAVGKNQVMINTSNLAAGMYVCKISSYGNTKSFTVMKR
jgi:hypothetical protein